MRTGRLWVYPDQRAALYSDGFSNWWIPLGGGIDDDCVSLADIVTQLSLDVGLTESDIDVSDLTDCVLGFLMPGQAAARSSIEQLMIAYAFDAVQSGLKIKFVKRGKSPVAAIALEDCGAHEAGTTAPEALKVSRLDDVALPARVNVKYINRDSDYLIGAQISQRLTGRAQSELTVDVPVVLHDSHAKAIADLMLFTAWTARVRAQWANPVDHLRIEPTDVVTIEGRSLYITKRVLDGFILKYEAEGDPGMALIGGAVAGAALPPPDLGIGTAPLTEMQLVDSALLRDADDAPGAYLAMWPASAPTDWRGAQLYSRVAGVGSWLRVDSTSSPGDYAGVTIGALGDFAGGHVFDNGNEVEVAMQNGAPYSVTRAEVLAGGNLAFIGRPGRWEVVAYQDATLTSSDTYVLSKLLRGLFGTEWAIGSHLAGDRVILVNLTTVNDYGIRAADIGASYDYRPVSNGRTLELTPVTTTSIAGERLKPLAPTNLRIVRDIGSGDATMTWDRRSRLNAAHLATVAPPIGESSEVYDVEVFADDTFAGIVRTFSGLTSAQCDYSASLQTADFGAPPATLSVRVYQVSATVGRGHDLEGTK
jgi:hypothetical protein